jgi:hypothetical protein
MQKIWHCPACSSKNSDWKNVYYADNNTVLKKANDLYISFCSNRNFHLVISSKEITVKKQSIEKELN